MREIFTYCVSLNSITGLDTWNTSSVIDMSGIFANCSVLTHIEDIQQWDVSNVNNLSYLFLNNSSLTALDLSTWDTSSVSTFQQTFNGCKSLTSLAGVENWNTSNAANLSGAFEGCESLTSLDLSAWSTSSVTTCDRTFMDCTSLTSLNVTGWDVSNVTNMSEMFCNCVVLTGVDLDSWNISPTTSTLGMFEGANPNIQVAVYCFCEGTIITTDQGEVAIEQIDTKNTINGFKVNNVTKSPNLFEKMIILKADSMCKNVPRRDVCVSPIHGIYVGRLQKAKDLLCDGENIKSVREKENKYGYNILLEDDKGNVIKSLINANGLMCGSVYVNKNEENEISKHYKY